jgi:hypothetical protein
MSHENEAAAPAVTERDIYFIETFLRQRGDHQSILAIDALVLRDDLDDATKTAKLQATLQGVINGKR